LTFDHVVRGDEDLLVEREPLLEDVPEEVLDDVLVVLVPVDLLGEPDRQGLPHPPLLEVVVELLVEEAAQEERLVEDGRPLRDLRLEGVVVVGAEDQGDVVAQLRVLGRRGLVDGDRLENVSNFVKVCLLLYTITFNNLIVQNNKQTSKHNTFRHHTNWSSFHQMS